MNKPSEYGIAVRMISTDGEEGYEARVAELPDVVCFGDTFSEAYESALETIAGLQEQYSELGKPFPAPERPVECDFSGRVTLRMSRSMHAAVQRRAAMDGVSLNQWIVEAVALRVERKGAADFVFVASPAHSSTGPVLAIQPATRVTQVDSHGQKVGLYLTHQCSVLPVAVLSSGGKEYV